jgi:hypothetical protein
MVDFSTRLFKTKFRISFVYNSTENEVNKVNKSYSSFSSLHELSPQHPV